MVIEIWLNTTLVEIWSEWSSLAGGDWKRKREPGNFDQQLVQFVAKRCYCSSCKREPKCGKKKEAQAILMLELPTRWQFGTFTSQAVDTILSNNTSTSFPDSTKWEDPGKEDGNNSSDLFPWSLGQVMPKGGTHVLPISKWLMSLSACFFH